MKILVFEDTEKHIEAAKEQLKDHDLTIVSSWKEFIGYPDHTYDYHGALNYEFIEEPEKFLEHLGRFDVALLDVNVPGILDINNSEPEAAIGPIALIKALEAGVPYIALITDKDHHDDAVSNSFDLWLRYRGEPFMIGSSKLLLTSDLICWNSEDELIKNWSKAVEKLCG